ncbi:hypothetical protein CORC01_08119 [Colletotrichum orchidophilum]|uniref:NmrA-like domain-containing protein n=1 Tax=Colletotrichum orchidophilum TaxID=1209926 RepID=A0A1G4B538_9PEZI|nr:uncharacterized protein CORC01_08119 [Colletotrichum orchidophilum]OHE96521.1 hypothetical protein CORC01_08119 [Colletotrichum orchidophilum]
MAPRSLRFAKDQPTGFVNRIEKVAIVGAAGTMGKFVTRELLKGGKHTITAITRHDSNSKLPEGVIAAKVNYEEMSSIVEALAGQQYLIITMKSTVGQETQNKLVRAAAKAGVPYVMPNAWGPDPKNDGMMKDALLGSSFEGAIKEIERLGVSEWIIMSCGFWYEYSVAGSPNRYGFDIKNKSLTLFDEGDVKINTSTWSQCGRGLAAFLNLKWLPDDKDDKSPSIQKWANDVFYISSFLASQRDMFESMKRVTSTADEDWDIKHESSKKRWEAGHDALRSGDRNGFSRLMYSRIFFSSTDGDVEHKHGLANAALNLPKEDLDKATAEAVQMCISGELDSY